MKNSLKKNKIRHLKIKNYKFERVENFKYANKTYFMLQKFFQK